MLYYYAKNVFTPPCFSDAFCAPVRMRSPHTYLLKFKLKTYINNRVTYPLFINNTHFKKCAAIAFQRVE